MENQKSKTEIVSQYETRLTRREDIKVPFGEITEETMYFGRDYYAAVSKSLIEDLSVEHQIALFLAYDGSVVGAEILAKGTEEQVSFSPRKVVRTAIMLNSRFVVLVHNHPQNATTTCSEMDKVAYSLSERQLDKYDITLVDSMVLTDSGNWSSVSAAMREDSCPATLGTASGTMRGRGYQPAPFLMKTELSRKEKLSREIRECFEKLLKNITAIVFLVMIMAEGSFFSLEKSFTFDQILSLVLQKPILGPVIICISILCFAILDNILDLIILTFQKFKKDETEIQKLEMICSFRNDCLDIATNYLLESSDTKNKGLLILNSLQSNSMMVEKSWYQKRTLAEIEMKISQLKISMNI